jgi:hypothetical protein
MLTPFLFARHLAQRREAPELEAALSRIVRGCAGWLKLNIPTDGGNPGPYNGRSYDGLYILKGGGKQS